MKNFTFIYVAINKSIPNMVKIGCTRRNPNERIEELDTTGIPTPFEVGFVACVEDSPKLEKLVHNYLVNHRVREVREFFHLTVQRARKSILEVANTNNIEIFFEKMSENLEEQNNSIAVSTKSSFDDDFPIIENKFFKALSSLDYKKTIELWKICAFDCQEQMIYDDVCFDLINKPLFENYCRKIRILGNESFDVLFQSILPEIYTLVTATDKYYSLFLYARYIFQLDHSSKVIALESFKKAQNKSELITSAVLFYLSGQENEAEKIFYSDLPGYEEGIDFSMLFLGSYRNYTDALFSFTASQIKRYELTRDKPPDFYLSYSKAIISGLSKFFQKSLQQVLLTHGDDSSLVSFLRIGNATNNFLKQHDSISYLEYKFLLDDYFGRYLFDG